VVARWRSYPWLMLRINPSVVVSVRTRRWAAAAFGHRLAPEVVMLLASGRCADPVEAGERLLDAERNPSVGISIRR
jgi:hypothetical protein